MTDQVGHSSYFPHFKPERLLDIEKLSFQVVFTEGILSKVCFAVNNPFVHYWGPHSGCHRSKIRQRTLTLLRLVDKGDFGNLSIAQGLGRLKRHLLQTDASGYFNDARLNAQFFINPPKHQS